ncbi:Na/Pi cotransporter family protein [Rheinheimera oceanensis]|uniref:Na/Pi cotransporter family protein n=1 Tax=Rheinheimera oceanensis TaxID=2817449 RepID=UPI001BFE395C|nr:Na/Pi symporter [Rheinheimera oceanensis]
MWTDMLMAFGALGLILLGMDWMSQGLKVAAGPNLLQFLQRWTNTPLQGVAFGTVATVAVQSSSAITVTTIGFVNAGILSLQNAAFVIYGSNVGTSLTGWFIALVGLQFKIDALALPIIGLGALLKLFGRSSRNKGMGEGLLGFGLLFLGLAFLKQSFDTAFVDINFSGLAQLGVWGILAGVLLGTLLSTLMQASIAVIALVITAVSTGIIPLSLAAAFVIGANLGTTSTALMSTLAATAKAKRLAWLHVIFNVLTGLVALLLLSPLLWGINLLQQWLFSTPQPAVSLALFHTLFNVLGVLLMWPVTGRLVLWLNKRFRRQNSAGLRYLDASSLAIPALAINGLGAELLRVGQLIAAQAVRLAQAQPTEADSIDDIRSLQAEINSYMHRLGREPLPAEEAMLLNELVKSQLQLEMTLQLLPVLTQHLAADIAVFHNEAELWELLSRATWPDDAGQIRSSYRELLRQREQNKKQLYTLVLQERVSKDAGGEQLLRLAETKRFTRQLTRALLSLGALQSRFEPLTDNKEATDAA